MAISYLPPTDAQALEALTDAQSQLAGTPDKGALAWDVVTLTAYGVSKGIDLSGLVTMPQTRMDNHAARAKALIDPLLADPKGINWQNFGNILKTLLPILLGLLSGLGGGTTGS
jgi:hypothetical protein